MRVEEAADHQVGLARAAVPGAEAQALEAGLVSIEAPTAGMADGAVRNSVGDGLWTQIVMRPDILNPLFAEATSLKGVGPALAKPLERLKLTRVVDVAFHLPTGWVDRLPRDELMQADVGPDDRDRR